MTPGFSDEGVEVEEIEELRAGNVLANGQPLPGDDSNDSAAQWYRLKHARSTRVWRFRIENLAERKVDEAERRAERAARMQELIARKNLGGVDFTPSPPAGGLVAHLFSELVGTHGFPAADLLVQYFVHVNEGWRAGAETQLHGMSQTCSPKWVAGDHAGEYAAHFGHPFELSMWKDPSTVRAPGGSVSDGSEAGVGGVQRQAGGAGLSASGLGSVSMGTLFVQVMSRTRFNRFMVEGYGYIPLLPEAGMQTHRCAPPFSPPL
ncbi:hypothetical protein T492DRAFT_531465 [Pavlovales sp. CCMP2436]|nr:hypothetical protein T492DRAFT_531465 [Pavlovales sp. CCMP2436]